MSSKTVPCVEVHRAVDGSVERGEPPLSRLLHLPCSGRVATGGVDDRVHRAGHRGVLRPVRLQLVRRIRGLRDAEVRATRAVVHTRLAQPWVHLHDLAVDDSRGAGIDRSRVVVLIVPNRDGHVRPMREVLRDGVTVCPTAVQTDVVLVVQMVHAVDGIKGGTVRIVLAAGRVLDVELRRVRAKGPGRARLETRAAGRRAGAEDALTDVAKRKLGESGNHLLWRY